MLDKLKLFNKEKSDRSSKTAVSKRTSSSSGFSSARSERSDSSLSLNDGQTQTTATTKLLPPSSVKKPDQLLQSACAKSKTKLLTSSKSNASGKETIFAPKSKSDKKDKSPARTADESKLAATTKLQKPCPTAAKDPKLKPVVVTTSNKKLEVRSESRNSLTSQLQAPKATATAPPPPPPNGTGIPKPTAFIKGTTKSTPNALKEGTTTTTTSSTTLSTTGELKPDKLDISTCEQVVNQSTYHHAVSSSGHQLNPNISMTDSSHSKSTHSSSTGLHSNSSESSVIYRPSSESGSDALYIKSSSGAMSPPPLSRNVIPNRKMDHFAVQQMPQQQQQHQHQLHLQQDGGHKFNTVPSKMMNGIIFEEEKQMTILPMRPLLRGYNSHVTLPTRGTRGQHLVADYCEEGQGYCSDGDALRKIPVRYSDIDNGYMSEGSGGLQNGGAKHMISVMRARTQLPPTIEER